MIISRRRKNGGIVRNEDNETKESGEIKARKEI
jgi:hypothetical protein